MSDKHRSLPTIPSVADILRQQRSPSPTTHPNSGDYPANRMHIHIDMSEAHYLPGVHHHHENMQVDSGLGDNTCSTRPPAPTVAYTTPDLSTYSAVRLARRAASPPPPSPLLLP
jgi:hypothetical protein